MTILYFIADQLSMNDVIDELAKLHRRIML